jgi:hypothetical protein
LALQVQQALLVLPVRLALKGLLVQVERSTNPTILEELA